MSGERVRLVVPRANAENQLQSQIEEGSRLAQGPVPNRARVKEIRQDYKLWHNRNAKILQIIFNSDLLSNQYWESQPALSLNYPSDNHELREIRGAVASGIEHLKQTLSDLSLYESSSATEPKQEPVDIAIITIIPDEYMSVLERLTSPEKFPGTHREPNTWGWVTGKIPNRAGSYFRVVLAMSGQHGNSMANMATSDTIKKFHPRYFILVGIAGGFPRDNCLKGDVVVSKVIYFYEYGKIADGNFAARHDNVYRCDSGLVNSAQIYAASNFDWISRISVEFPEETRPKCLFGAVASGDKLVDDTAYNYFSEVYESWPDLQAVEMEGAGFASAVEHAKSQGENTGYIMVRGISDMPRSSMVETPASGVQRPNSQSRQRDQWKRAACSSAASFILGWISTDWLIPPQSTNR